MGATDTDRVKKAAEWFYSNIFREESIRPRETPKKEKLPAALKAARSLESGLGARDSRNTLFLKQAKLLEFYTDDYPFDREVVCYYPTYQSLSDQELRGYFSWRTRLREGDLQKTSLSFAFLYLYELLNQIGVTDPLDGFEKLLRFHRDYGALDRRVLPYLDQWLQEYAAYYELDPSLLQATPQLRFDRCVEVLEDVHTRQSADVIEALKYFTGWLNRSKFYRQNQTDMDTVLVGVLRRVHDHYAKCKYTFVTQYFGRPWEQYAAPFSTAVFSYRQKHRDLEYRLSRYTVYTCKNGAWTLHRLDTHQVPHRKLTQLVKTVDALMRQEYGDPHPVKMELDTKWLTKLILEEIHALQEAKKEAEARRITIDLSKLSAIRSDAAITRDKLTVEEEPEQEEAPPPEPAAPEDTPLSKAEFRLLHDLLYGKSLGWVQAEGQLMSVLADSINEKLYDTFADSVLEMTDPPGLVDDYIDELKEMIRP